MGRLQAKAFGVGKPFMVSRQLPIYFLKLHLLCEHCPITHKKLVMQQQFLEMIQ